MTNAGNQAHILRVCRENHTMENGKDAPERSFRGIRVITNQTQRGGNFSQAVHVFSLIFAMLGYERISFAFKEAHSY